MTFHFDDFIKQGVYLRGWSKKTVRTYKQGLNAFQQSLGVAGSQELGNTTKAQLNAFVISMRQRGLSERA